MRLRTASIATALLLVAGASTPAVPAEGAPKREARTAASVLAGMTLPQRVGELLMVGTPTSRPSTAALATIGRYHVGSVILMGNSTGGRAEVAPTVAAFQARSSSAATASTRLFVAVDQEGGKVQHLKGPGFAAMPSALTQGTWAPSALRAEARSWAGQLSAAGVNLDLAPVTDTVPAAHADDNAPIGHWQRELGHRPGPVGTHAAAIVRGMGAAGVATSAKHFPGLGRVTGNTDLVRTVVDRRTTRRDAYLKPFAATIEAGVPLVMMSLATYRRIDAGVPAAFSRRIVTGMLRHDLAFDGVVISDSLTAAAAQRYGAGERAVRFVQAGGDIALVTEAGPIAAMYAALLDKARTDPAFRKRVDASALRVLQAKERFGLL